MEIMSILGAGMTRMEYKEIKAINFKKYLKEFYQEVNCDCNIMFEHCIKGPGLICYTLCGCMRMLIPIDLHMKVRNVFMNVVPE